MGPHIDFLNSMLLDVSKKFYTITLTVLLMDLFSTHVVYNNFQFDTISSILVTIERYPQYVKKLYPQYKIEKAPMQRSKHMKQSRFKSKDIHTFFAPIFATFYLHHNLSKKPAQHWCLAQVNFAWIVKYLFHSFNSINYHILISVIPWIIYGFPN